MKKTIVIVLVLSLVAYVGLTYFLGSVVKVGVTDRPDNAALYLAYRRGYFDRQGIKVEFVGGGSAASDFVPALGLNQVQVAAGSPNAGFYNALNACFTLHELNHSHWAQVHENGYPVALEEDGIPNWKVAPPTVPMEKNSVRAEG